VFRMNISKLGFFFIFLVSWRGVRLSPLGIRRPLTGLLYPPRMIDDECGAVGGMRIGRVYRSTRQTKPTPAPFSPPQIQHDLTRARILAAAVGSRRLTA
jgi:hypothetical protein